MCKCCILQNRLLAHAPAAHQEPAGNAVDVLASDCFVQHLPLSSKYYQSALRQDWARYTRYLGPPTIPTSHPMSSLVALLHLLLRASCMRLPLHRRRGVPEGGYRTTHTLILLPLFAERRLLHDPSCMSTVLTQPPTQPENCCTTPRRPLTQPWSHVRRGR